MDPLKLALIDLNRMEPRIFNLIEEGEIDPWDIDIVKLCSLYLREIRNGADLRISGNALLTAAVLLKMKSEIFDEREEREDIEIVLEAPDIEIIPISRKVDRKVTVFELIEALREAFELERRKIRSRAIKPDIKFYVMDITRVMERLLQELPEEVTVEAVGAITFLALLHLAMKGAIEIEQEEWNGTIRIRKLGGSSLVHSGKMDKLRGTV